jgi:serine/threonine-protein kinase ATR
MGLVSLVSKVCYLLLPIINLMFLTNLIGVFRIACEITLGLLRDNRNSLMSVLDAFIHDPLVEWEEQSKKQVRKHCFH